MSEYVGEYVVSLTAKTFTDLRFHRHEEIVRCRDCEYYDGEPDLDSSEPKCWRDPDHKGTPIWTRPDGFCAWGERRD